MSSKEMKFLKILFAFTDITGQYINTVLATCKTCRNLFQPDAKWSAGGCVLQDP